MRAKRRASPPGAPLLPFVRNCSTLDDKSSSACRSSSVARAAVADCAVADSEAVAAALAALRARCT